MEATQLTPAGIANSSTHPLLLAAAASVTLLSLAGVGTLAGWLPGPGNHSTEPARMASVTPQAPAAAPAIIQPPAAVSPVKPAARSAERTPVSTRRTTSLPAANDALPAATYPRNTYPVTQNEPVLTYPTAAVLPPICRDCGVVQAVNEVAVEPKTSNGGAVAGGIVGSIIGNQFGKGATRDIATILGAVGGAYAGNHIEKSVKESKRYDVVVRFEDGSTRTFSSDAPPTWQSGDRVKLQNGLLTMGGGKSGATAGTI